MTNCFAPANAVHLRQACPVLITGDYRNFQSGIEMSYVMLAFGWCQCTLCASRHPANPRLNLNDCGIGHVALTLQGAARLADAQF